MAVALLQVTGLDGNYRITCHTVMEVLREHKDSVMAVLEAFVYDPLLNWRLMDSEYQQVLGSQSRHPPQAGVSDTARFTDLGPVQPGA